MRSLRVLALLGVVVGGWSTAAATPAAAQGTDGVCTDPDGVTVVVDFQELGGGVNVRCAAWSPGLTGFGALQGAGVNYQTAVRFPGFLCKIAGKPADDRCIDASPASAYWSYWLAPRGGQWCYSNWGAGSRLVPRGGIEAWSFSYRRTASTSPPPRLPVPAALAGAAPSPLAGNDCDARADAPKPTETTPTTPPTPTTPSPSPVAAPGDEVGGAPVSGGNGVPGVTITTAGPGHGSGASGATTTIAETVGSESSTAGGDSTPGDESAEDAEVLSELAGGRTGSEADEPDETAVGSVDLSSDGTTRSSTPAGAVLAVALVLALAGGATVRNRRRAAGVE